jgi:hypothetical protein
LGVITSTLKKRGRKSRQLQEDSRARRFKSKKIQEIDEDEDEDKDEDKDNGPRQ